MTASTTDLPAGVRAVFFDAVGTLIDPVPSAGSAYAEFGTRFGSRLRRDDIRRRFGEAFQAEEDHDARSGHRTDEARERQRWANIVRTVLNDVADRDGLFDALYAHFADPAAWRAKADAPAVLAGLRESGVVVGVASNFDHRLHAVLAGLPALGRFDRVFISSEVGYKKPGDGFFAEMCRRSGLSPREILLVGDDVDNDYLGATRAGFHARLLSAAGVPGVPPADVVATLADLTRPGVPAGA